jgi:glycosyltransferase involved in cell wall biosynthesis
VISIIIPAYNEEALLVPTLRAVRESADATGVPYEVIVVDDGSTDRTAEIAKAGGARVVSVNLRQIGAARNAGAKVAAGDLLIFVDADTLVSAGVLRAAVAAVDAGAVGGGSAAQTDSNDPWWGPPAMVLASWLMRTARWAAGCFLFVRADVFRAVGGFDEQYFASEEIHLSRAVKKHGRFVILRELVTTSGRKGRLFTTRQFVWQFARALWPPTLKRRDRLEIWYGGEREKSGNEQSDDRDPRGPGAAAHLRQGSGGQAAAGAGRADDPGNARSRGPGDQL